MQPLCLAALLAVVFIAGGCGFSGRSNAVPDELVDVAGIRNAPFARLWGDRPPDDIDERLALASAQWKETSAASAAQGSLNILTISGGGADGAFGAGLLKGWSEAGGRPEFAVVTGVSTGALLAPLAFLGPDYDDEAERLYTSTSTRDIIRKRGPIIGFFSDAMADTKPLRERIDEVVDDQMIADLAAAYGRGRRLYIGTTNLDARRPVIWNIGAIASAGGTEAQELIAQVILASAAIPGAFPPVYIPVEANGRRFEEMHVDGGVTSQVFLYPVAIDLQSVAAEVGLSGDSRIYVIRNSTIWPKPATVTPRLMPIGKASVATIISSQGLGDLYRLYLQAERNDLDYNLAFIPADVQAESRESFDAKYMRTLFDLGYTMARDGYPWEKSPPGITE